MSQEENGELKMKTMSDLMHKEVKDIPKNCLHLF